MISRGTEIFRDRTGTLQPTAMFRGPDGALYDRNMKPIVPPKSRREKVLTGIATVLLLPIAAPFILVASPYLGFKMIRAIHRGD